MNQNLTLCHLCGLGATYPKHPPVEFLVGHVLVGVTPCGRCAIVALLPQITKLPKKSQNNCFKIVS